MAPNVVSHLKNDLIDVILLEFVFGLQGTGRSLFIQSRKLLMSFVVTDPIVLSGAKYEANNWISPLKALIV